MVHPFLYLMEHYFDAAQRNIHAHHRAPRTSAGQPAANGSHEEEVPCCGQGEISCSCNGLESCSTRYCGDGNETKIASDDGSKSGTG